MRPRPERLLRTDTQRPPRGIVRIAALLGSLALTSGLGTSFAEGARAFTPVSGNTAQHSNTAPHSNVALNSKVTGRADSSNHGSSTPRVVLIGLSGASWDDLDLMPQLAALVTGSDPSSVPSDPVMLGNLVVRSTSGPSCPMDGWLAVSSGTRAWDRVDGECATTTTGTSSAEEALPEGASADAASIDDSSIDGSSSEVPRWSDYVDQAQSQPYDAHLGGLGDAIRASGISAAAIGSGAQVALADSMGLVAGTSSMPTTASAFTRAVEAASAAQLLVVDVGDTTATTTATQSGAASARAESSTSQMATVDQRIGTVITAARRADPTLSSTRILVASLADGAASTTTPRLRLLVSIGGADASESGSGLLTSDSTRQPGLSLTTDLQPTVLASLGLTAEVRGSTGSVLAPAGNGTPDPDATAANRQSLDSVLDQLRHSDQGARLEAPAMTIAILIVIALILTATFVPRNGPRLIRRVPVLPAAGLAVAAIPVGCTLTNALPWWRFGSPSWAFTLISLAWIIAITILALVAVALRSTQKPLINGRSADQSRWGLGVGVGVVAGITWVVLTVDVWRGAPWQLSGIFGTQPHVAGRFYGMNNTSFTLFAVATLVLCGLLGKAFARRRRLTVAWGVMIGFGALSVVIDAAPSLGADLGGPLALIPGLAMVGLAATGVRLRARHVIIAGVAAIGVVVAAALLDWSRPEPARTHLGRFVQQVIDGQAGAVIGRKATAAFGDVLGTVPGALGFVVVVALLWLLVRAWRDAGPWPQWWWGVLATLVLAALVNDSGLAMPRLGLVFAAPMAIAVVGCRRFAVSAESRHGELPQCPPELDAR